MHIRPFALILLLIALAVATLPLAFHHPVAPLAEDHTAGGACAEAADSMDCYAETLEELVAMKSVAAAFADLRERYAQDPAVAGECHQLAHAIGHAAINKYPTPAEAFAHGDNFCWSGYYHGAIEILVKDLPADTLQATVNTLCDAIEGADRYSFDYYNCVHGLGHGVMTHQNGQMHEALAICRAFPESWEQRSCAGGVFMEHVMTENRPGVPKFFRNDNPLSPCTEVDEWAKEQCYLMQTSHILGTMNGDFGKTFAACEDAEPAYRTTCFQSIGRDASGRTVSDLAKTRGLCERGTSPEARFHCYLGAAKDFVSYFHSDTEAHALCTTLADEERAACANAVAAHYRSF